jgi:phosphatidylserine/phosphatidylglycerophosphate/cardiolipin synthase-like enzyme
MTHRFLLAALLFAGCALESPDGIDEAGVVPGGKADGSDFSACELAAVVTWLNEGVDHDALLDADVHSRAAHNIVSRRDGADGAFGTSDDVLFADIAAVDAVPWVGPAAMRALAGAVADRCVASTTDVIFSPQPYETSHLLRIRELIDAATTSIDLALYSFSDARIMDALGRAVARGVVVRLIFEDAGSQRNAPSGTTSGRLETMGVEVRYINKIMHHKFAILDRATLVTGSGNWSNSAATRYDENTVFIQGNAELTLSYQREFDLLWQYSRPLVWNEEIEHVVTEPVTDIPDDPSVEALFTSANFRAYESATNGGTFSVIPGRSVVADRWVELIRGARRSIRIASGHLRSRAISEALLEAHANNPELDIRVYLDGQEYLAESTHRIQEQELEACLVRAGMNEGARQACTDRGFLFSYQLHAAGIALRYKYYAYRWHYSYAAQMHHKYMIVDDTTLVTGSYNLSDNAEHATMENVLILEDAALIAEFAANFDAMWTTGEGRYETLMSAMTSGTGNVSLVFDSMSLDWTEVTALKRAIRAACPLVDSTEYRTRPEAHLFCPR